MRVFFTLFLLVIIIGGFFLVKNTRTITVDDIQPGDSLYGLDLWMERVKSRFAGTNEAKAEIALENASERLSELVESAESNNTAGIESAANGLKQSLSIAIDSTYRIAEPSIRKTIREATERIAEEAKPMLANVSARVEMETQKAIATAIESLQNELDRVFEDIKERAKEEIREEMTELGDRLKETLQEQLKAIGENIRNNEPSEN